MTVLFDLDGTLLDTAPDFIFSINQLRMEEGLKPLELSHIRASISHGLTQIIKAAFNISTEDPAYASLSARLLAIYEQHLGQLTKPFPGMFELLSTLEQQNIPWGIVTNRPSQYTQLLLKSMNLLNRPRCIVSGDTTPYSKPHPGSLLFACKKMTIHPRHCIYVGDAEHDIIAGKAAGMATIGVLFGYIEDPSSALQWGADHYAYHADDIFPWVLAWHSI